MPSTKDDEKPPLLDERKSAQNAKVLWAAIGGAATLFHGTVSHLTGIPSDLTVSPAALGMVMLAVVQRQENGVNRILDDPPRDDYQTPTKAKSRRYVTGQLGAGDLALAIDNAAIATLHYTAYLEATVRADERGQGARRAGDYKAAEDREFEAGVFIERARAANVSKAEALTNLAIVWARFGTGMALDGPPGTQQLAVTADRGSAVRGARLVVKDLHLDREVASGVSVVQASEGEVSADGLVLSAVERTQRLSVDSLAFYADARSNLAPELVSRQRRRGWGIRPVAEIEAEGEALERGLEDWRRGDIGAARKTVDEISARVDLNDHIRRLSAPLLEDAREEPRELPPARDGSDSDEVDR